MAERRGFIRRQTATKTRLETMTGQSLADAAIVADLSVNGARIETTAELVVGSLYRLVLEGTSTPFEVEILDKTGNQYRCLIKTSCANLNDVIRESDDLTLLLLEQNEPKNGQD